MNKKDELEIKSENEERITVMNNNKYRNEGERCGSSNSPPVNLLGVVDERELIRLVIEAATETAEKGLVKPVYNMPNWIPKNMLLSVITYAYATCVFSSVDLAEGVRKNTALRYLASGIFPDHWAFIKFRRVNAHSIIYSLNCVIKKVKELCGEGKTACAPLAAVSAGEAAVDKVAERIKSPDCHLEFDGERRLAYAVMRDCFEMDF
ncbi:MAG: transposase [Verrucomicrobiia bacterium]